MELDRLKKKNEELKQELSRLKLREKELEMVLNRITSAKAFRLWQGLNQLKRHFYLGINFFRLIPLILIRLFVALAYFTLFSIYFFFFKILSFITLPFSKKIKIDKQHYHLDGLSIEVLTWNKKKLIINTLLNLAKVIDAENLKIPYEIIVVDNGSTDGTVEAIKKIKKLKNKVRIIALDKNYGFSKAYNLAVKQAKYNWVYIMNNDMIVRKGTFVHIIKALQKLHSRGVKNIFSLTSQIFFFDKSKRREESGKTYIQYELGYLNVAHEVKDEFLDKASSTLYFGGGSSLINKFLFYKLGGFEEKIIYPFYSEDLDLGYRAWKYGFQNLYIPNSKIIHYHRATNKNKELVDYIIKRNALFIVIKNFDDIDLIVKNLIFYPIRIIISADHFKIGLEAIFRYHYFIYSKLKSLLIKKGNSDKEIFAKQYLSLNF